MKRTAKKILAILAGAAALSVYAQDNNAPAQFPPAQPQPTTSVTTPMTNVRPLALGDTPKAVQQSAREHAHDGLVRDVDQANWNGQTVYSVVVDNHGRISQFVFDQNGKVVSEPGRPISEAAGAQPNHSKQPNTDAQHDHQILQQPK